MASKLSFIYSLILLHLCLSRVCTSFMYEVMNVILLQIYPNIKSILLASTSQPIRAASTLLHLVSVHSH